MPLGIYVPAALNDLAVDVAVGTPAQGAVFYRGATKWNSLAAGTSGQVLTSGGAAANPTWTTPFSGAHSALTGLTTGDDHTQYALLAGRSGGQTLNGDTASGGSLTLVSTAHATKGNIILTGVPSSPGAGTNSERWGLGSAAAGLRGTALGQTASAGGQDSVAIGYGAQASALTSNAIGWTANASATNAFAFGRAAVASASGAMAFGPNTTAAAVDNVVIGSSATISDVSAQYGIAIGSNAAVSGTATNRIALGGFAANSGGIGVIAIGRGSSMTGTAGYSVCVGYLASDGGFSSTILLGGSATATAANQLIVGSTNLSITSCYLGKGVTNASPVAVSINATGGSGADIAGANLILAGGKATGAALGGDLIFQSTIAASSSSTLNSLQEKWRVSCASVATWTVRSSTSDRSAFDITPTFATATDASRKARAVFNIWDTAAREALRIEADGTNPMIGFLGAAALARPAAYTQTYATASRTHANPTSADLTGITSSTTGSALAEPGASYAQAVQQQNFRRIQDQFVALRADVLNLKQVVNQVIDDLQAFGLAA